jgi:hypothetical protein
MRGLRQSQKGASVSLDLRAREEANVYREIQAEGYLCVSGAALQPGQQYYAVARQAPAVRSAPVGRALGGISTHYVLCSPYAASAVVVQGLGQATCAASVDAIYLEDLVILVDARSTAPQATQPVRPGTAGSAVLEMRPAHRSLSQKAQEELSEFEREYPW